MQLEVMLKQARDNCAYFNRFKHLSDNRIFISDF